MMALKTRFEQIVADYGSPIVFEKDGTVYHCRALLSPLTVPANTSIGCGTPAGIQRGYQYRCYYGDDAATLGEGDILQLGNKKFMVRSHSDVWYRDAILYRKALLEQVWEEENFE